MQQKLPITDGTINHVLEGMMSEAADSSPTEVAHKSCHLADKAPEFGISHPSPLWASCFAHAGDGGGYPAILCEKGS